MSDSSRHLYCVENCHIGGQLQTANPQEYTPKVRLHPGNVTFWVYIAYKQAGCWCDPWTKSWSLWAAFWELLTSLFGSLFWSLFSASPLASLSRWLPEPLFGSLFLEPFFSKPPCLTLEMALWAIFGSLECLPAGWLLFKLYRKPLRSLIIEETMVRLVVSKLLTKQVGSPVWTTQSL